MIENFSTFIVLTRCPGFIMFSVRIIVVFSSISLSFQIYLKVKLLAYVFHIEKVFVTR